MTKMIFILKHTSFTVRKYIKFYRKRYLCTTFDYYNLWLCIVYCIQKINASYYLNITLISIRLAYIFQ